MYPATPDLIARAEAMYVDAVGDLRRKLQDATPESRRACRSIAGRIGNIDGWLSVARKRGETRLSLDEILQRVEG